MRNQVKPERCLLASIGHGWLHCVGHALLPHAPCRTLGDARIRNPEFILKVALEWGIRVHGTYQLVDHIGVLYRHEWNTNLELFDSAALFHLNFHRLSRQCLNLDPHSVVMTNKLNCNEINVKIAITDIRHTKDRLNRALIIQFNSIQFRHFLWIHTPLTEKLYW